MSALNIVQVSIEIWGCIISLIISLFTASEVKKKKSGNMLWKMLLVNVLTLVSDSLAYVYHGDISTLGMAATRISNFMLLLLEYILLLLFAHYVQSVLEEHGFTYGRKWLAVIYALVGIMVCALVVTQFTGFYYYFDKTNHYCRGMGIVLNFAGTSLSIIIAVIQLARMYKKIDLRHVKVQILVGILPIVAMLIQFVGYGISLLNLAITCSIIIGYLQYYFGRIKADADLLVEEAKDETRQVMEKYEQLKKQTTGTEPFER